MHKSILLMVLMTLVWSCGEEAQKAEDLPPGWADELAIGAIDDLKADGDWGAAVECKAIPDLTPLADPRVVVSLDGLTLHLTDASSGFDRVYPIGPGAIKDGSSLTPVSTDRADQLFYLRQDMPTGKQNTNPDYMPWNYSYSCRIWWSNPDSGQRIPVFAGLPFMRLEGAPTLAYAIHGPVDSYTMPSGGRLRRGYVSHGCIRMEAADVLELFALTLGHKVPVRVQQAPERLEDGSQVDVNTPWLLADCTTNDDCSYDGGICHANPYTGRGYCTKPCLKYCPDEFGQPVSFCVPDPTDDSQGICTLKGSDFNNDCRRYPGFQLAPGIPRFGQEGVVADVCLPGSQGWVGAPCFSDLDCGLADGTCVLPPGSENSLGFCSTPCELYCPDLASYPGTFCVTAPEGSGQCVQKCTNNDDCPTNAQCTPDTPRNGQPGTTATVCLQWPE
jgi:hypothetical protein